jgi:hypothetical protein
MEFDHVQNPGRALGPAEPEPGRRPSQSRLRKALLVGVSIAALTISAPQLRAADIPPRAVVTKAPPPATDFGSLTMWIEGAAIWTGGDRARWGTTNSDVANFVDFTQLGASGGAGAFRPQVGWEAAIGADYRLPFSPWHVSFAARYGTSKSHDQTLGSSFTDPGAVGLVQSQAKITERESHAVADFMIGRDLGFGTPIGLSQVKFGVRAANLEAKLHADVQSYAVLPHQVCVSSSACNTVNVPTSASVSLDERSRFLGIGPRLAAEGSMPIDNSWSFDYNAGVAVLFGDRKLTMSGTGVSGSGFFGFGPTPPTWFNTEIKDRASILNADASAALAYALTPHAKLSVGVRFDGYWKALKTFDTAGNVVNGDRFFYGPFLRLTGKF